VTKPIDARLDVGRSTILVGKHLCELRNLTLGRDNEGDHRSTITTKQKLVVGKKTNSIK
jgi:hypothetical protein